MTSDRLPGMDDIPSVSDKALPLRISSMLRMYGRYEGECCWTCKHLTVNAQWHPYRYYKCDLFGLDTTASTDWRVGWPACGRWEER